MTTGSETQIPELRPEIVFISDLVRRLVDGSMRIPRFQRPFVWRRSQMTDLLDSVNRQYPIGSLLAWETPTRLASLPSIGPIAFQHETDSSVSYVLDGHQRLTTIAGALVAVRDRTVVDDDDSGRWNLFYNAQHGGFEHLAIDQEPEASQFPMSKLLDTFEYLEECQRVIAQDPDNGREYVERIQGVARTFQNFKIPVVQIRQTGLTQAVEIFARLNSKGSDMSADQMVSALLYREGTANDFDLSAEIDDVMERLTLEGFGDIDRNLVLRALLAATGEDIYRTDWTAVAADRRSALLSRLRAVINGVSDSLVAAVAYLKHEFGVTNERLIPYAMQLVVLSSFLYACPTPSQEQRVLVRRWFWVSSFAEWFGQGNPSRVNSLVRDVMDNVANQPDSPQFASFDIGTPASSLPTSFDMRSARTRAHLLVLLSLSPLDRDGTPLDDPDGRIQRFGPEALGKIYSRAADRDLNRSPANKLLRDQTEDRRQARSWLLDVSEDRIEDVWTSNGIPIAAKTFLDEGDGNRFLRARLAHLEQLEHEFMVRHGVTPPG